MTLDEARSAIDANRRDPTSNVFVEARNEITPELQFTPEMDAAREKETKWDKYGKFYSAEAETDPTAKFYYDRSGGETAVKSAVAYLNKGASQDRVDAAPSDIRGAVNALINTWDVENYPRFKEVEGAPAKTETKAGNEGFKLRNVEDTTNQASKMWILPNGEAVALGAEWHHDWLNKNAAEMSRRFGLAESDAKKSDLEGAREAALKKGFVRVNYQKGNGTLSVEARSRDWPKAKKAVERLVEENVDNLDRVHVTLFDEHASGIVESDSTAMFDMAPTEKLANIPFITKSEAKPAPSEAARPMSEVQRFRFLPEEGTPKIFEPSEEIRDVARKYMTGRGESFKDPSRIDGPPRDLAKKVADFYEKEKSNPDDPEVRKSYDALIQETIDQFKTLQAEGYVMEPYLEADYPKYFSKMITDMREKKHLYFQPTTHVFGRGILAEKGNPLLRETGIEIDGKPLLANDLFRVVHDFFGHAKEGYTFGPKGEFNAWKAHSDMYSPEAQGALAAETMAQNFWLNYGPHLRNESGALVKKGEPGYLEPKDWPFAEQKNIVIPQELIDEAKAQFLPEQENLPGIEAGREYDREAIKAMNRKELMEHFPESLIPRDPNEKIASDIVGSPLAKQAGSREKAVDAFAEKLVEFAKANQEDPAFIAGLAWYSEFTPLLKKELGADAPMFAELLAATSPQTAVTTNFGYAMDAIQSYKDGRFNKIIPKFNEGLEKIADGTWEKWYNREVRSGRLKNPPAKPSEAAFLAHWIETNDLKPTQANGKLYGTHSLNVLRVFARKWLDNTAGPKTQNFVKNLLGTGDEATIDLWADRTMRRLGYDGFKDRWRILPGYNQGVSEADFAFSQNVFRLAAQELETLPNALQGGAWFAEKKYWADRGWGLLDLGDFKAELQRAPELRKRYRENIAPKEKDQELGFDIQPRKR